MWISARSAISHDSRSRRARRDASALLGSSLRRVQRFISGTRGRWGLGLARRIQQGSLHIRYRLAPEVRSEANSFVRPWVPRSVFTQEHKVSARIRKPSLRTACGEGLSGDWFGGGLRGLPEDLICHTDCGSLTRGLALPPVFPPPIRYRSLGPPSTRTPYARFRSERPVPRESNGASGDVPECLRKH